MAPIVSRSLGETEPDPPRAEDGTTFGKMSVDAMNPVVLLSSVLRVSVFILHTSIRITGDDNIIVGILPKRLLIAALDITT
jgi:hypothetical protein